MENINNLQAQIQDEIDYNFIIRVQNEVTQSCALPFALPIERIPEYILQAAQYFWQNCDFSVEERYYFVMNSDIQKCSKLNKIIQLPQQIVGVHGVYKLQQNLRYGAMGDFSLERMILNNSALASGAGGSLSDVFGSGTGYNLTDVTGALYEVATYKAMFDTPLTFNYNPYSKTLAILGNLGYSDLVLQCHLRCKVQDLYKLHYFFRYCVCLTLRSLGTILGTFEYKLPGGITLNHSRFWDMANEEMLAYIQTESWKAGFKDILNPDTLQRCTQIDKATAGTSNVPLAHQSRLREKLPKRNAPQMLNNELNLFFKST